MVPWMFTENERWDCFRNSYMNMITSAIHFDQFSRDNKQFFVKKQRLNKMFISSPLPFAKS